MGAYDSPDRSILFEPDALRAEERRQERGDYRSDPGTGGRYHGPFYGRIATACRQRVCHCHDARIELLSDCSHCGCRPPKGA